jgi:hypothetical protein
MDRLVAGWAVGAFLLGDTLGSVGDWSVTTDFVASLTRTLACGGLSSLTLGVCRLTLDGDSWLGETRLALSVGRFMLPGSSSSGASSRLFVVCVVGRRRVSRMLSNLDLVWFSSAMGGLTLVVLGDLDNLVERRS